MDDFIDIRVIYSKKGKIKYVSHLDINRCMQRALKRSGLPVWYTQGFNPHPFITFALPLSLGFESEYECMDFRLTKQMEFKDIKKKLSKVMPKGIKILDIHYPINKSREIDSALYKITFKTENSALVKDNLKKLLTEEHIYVDKKTKSGMNTEDLKPNILHCKIDEKKKSVSLKLKLPAGNTMYNPNLLIDVFEKENSDIIKFIKVKRMALYTKDGNLFV